MLDFGLAKLTLEPAAAGSDPAVTAIVTHSPTLTLAATQAGVILGTAGYMSPEQAKGRDADKRSDVWAFGCVFYEMLSGRRAFDGEDISDTLASVLKTEPDWNAIPASVPAPIKTLLQRYPKSELAASAKWMVEHMRTETAPGFMNLEGDSTKSAGSNAAPTRKP